MLTMKKKATTLLAVILISTGLMSNARAQGPESLRQYHAPVGDSPEVAPPLAKDISSRLTKSDIKKAMKKVADWQIDRLKDGLTTDWTFGVLDTGLIAASDTLNDARYRNAVKRMGETISWKLGPNRIHADDQVVGQSYLAIYARERNPEQIAPLQRQFNELKAMPYDPQHPVWWWCDALFMAPPVWSGLYRVTGDRAYLDYMDREWWTTSEALYDPQEHLYWRDRKYLDRKEENGRKVFWLRGNGWALGGLARVLRDMPAGYRTRGKYVQQFSELAAKLASLQGEDGLWRAGLLDQKAYNLPETSGSALVTYGLAWGVNNGILQRSKYLPVIEKAWAGLVSHIYQDGRLGGVQPIGERPDSFRPTSSYVYGVGAFLLAGSELERLAPKQCPRKVASHRTTPRRAAARFGSRYARRDHECR